ncbi:farnesol dehydrogenase-like [Coccinella septempunctata]|uniref:farnesol dehydrogenase-like n=1 Tax=Coccinella septempunctata TaxID=41139 RepID=UPI001D089ACF|nr:farnesol dehydrogenase-like [Coccinella septempunctata]
MERWIGKLAVVTGASSGIGASIAEHLVQRGLRVVGLSRRMERMENLAERLQIHSGTLYGIQVDMTKTDDIIRAFERIEREYGPIHILVNSAGIFANTSLIDGDIKKWRDTFEVNVLGLCTATKESVASMMKHNIDGHIIHLNSVVGHRPVDFLGENVYPASKHAVTALTNSWRNELVKKGTKIKVTSISPGLVKNTEIFEASGSEMANVDFGEALTPKDISEAVLYVLNTPPHVQVHDIILRTTGSDV